MTDRLNLIDTIAGEPRFSTFSRYMDLSGSNAVFSRPGGFTVFVPTNDAFAKIPDDRMNAMLNEPGHVELKALLSYHIVPGKIMAANIGARQVRNSVTGDEMEFADYRGLKVNGADVQARNIEALDGVVHSLGTVLSPKPLAGSKPLDSTASPAAEPMQTVAQIPLASPGNVLPYPARSTSAATPGLPANAAAAIPLAAKAADTAKPIF